MLTQFIGSNKPSARFKMYRVLRLLNSSEGSRTSMSAINGKKVAIVGGGPGGLTLARLLQQSGAKVAVYERDQSHNARVQGSALDLHEDSGLAALEDAGVMGAFWGNHRSDIHHL